MKEIKQDVFSSQHQHSHDDETFEATLHVVRQERGIDKVEPFWKGAPKFLCHIVDYLLAQP